MILQALLHLLRQGGQPLHGCADTTPQPAVDLARFCGRWYELARYDSFFQHGLEDVHADYALVDNGRLHIVNSGTTANGRVRHARAGAYVPRPATPGLLRVSFVPPYRWFYSDYRILYVDSEYRNALVSGPDSRYLWLLSRNPAVSAQDFFDLLRAAESRGFLAEHLHITRHNRRFIEQPAVGICLQNR